MNNLHRDIKQGEVVVIGKKWLKPEYQDLYTRLFECNGYGFGCRSAAVGRAIFGRWLHSGEEGRIDGDMIDKAETEQYQATHQDNVKKPIWRGAYLDE